MHQLFRYRCVFFASVTNKWPTNMIGIVNGLIICSWSSIFSIIDSNTRAWWRSSCHKGKILHSGWVFGMSRSFKSPIRFDFFKVLWGSPCILYNVEHDDARMLTWGHLWIRYRESAQPVVTDGITVTPTSPAQWTRKTSAVSSVTVATSFSGCTCGSTSSCDGQQPRVFHSPRYRQTPQSSRRQGNESFNPPKIGASLFFPV